MLKAYVERRKLNFANRNELPLFLHENGQIYSKVEFNSDLSDLLAVYPELINDRDSFSGHSFRSGLSTILSVLGFSKEEIQNPPAQVSYLEEGFVRSLGISREELEPRADHCTRCVYILLRTE